MQRMKIAAARLLSMHGLLAFVAVMSLVLVTLVSTARQASATPNFKAPWSCGVGWHASTYAGHGLAVDFNNLADGSDAGKPVLASASGTATIVPNNGNGYGNYVDINHGGGWITKYAHLASVPSIVDRNGSQSGIQVNQGDHIGNVGNTGTSDGAHLHFEQRFNGAKQAVVFDSVTIPVGTTRTTSDPVHVSTNCGPAAAEWHWYLRNANSNGDPHAIFGYGSTPGDMPITGDWDGDGTTTPGIVRNVNGEWQWHLRNTNNSGGAQVVVGYGSASSDYPITGDWDGNGTTTVGIVRNVNGVWQWHLSNDQGAGATHSVFEYGSALTDHPVVGDWDGDGTTTPGIVRNVNGARHWYLRNANSNGDPHAIFGYGSASGDHPIVGDWDGNGTTTVGIVRNVNGVLQWHLSNDHGATTHAVLEYGSTSTDHPITGDWDGNGTTTVGITRPAG